MMSIYTRTAVLTGLSVLLSGPAMVGTCQCVHWSRAGQVGFWCAGQ